MQRYTLLYAIPNTSVATLCCNRKHLSSFSQCFNNRFRYLLQLDLSYDVDGVKIVDMSDRKNDVSHSLQLQASRDQDHMQLQQRDREQLHRDKLQPQRDRDREREHLHQLQSINNLLLDLPSPNSFQGYSHDAVCPPSNKSNNIDGKIRFTLHNSCLISMQRCSFFFLVSR